MRSTSHPMTNREALMTVDDWSEQVDIVLSQPVTERDSAPPRDDDRDASKSVVSGRDVPT